MPELTDQKRSPAAPEVAASDANAELERLFASPDFAASRRRKALLAYLVKQSIEDPSVGLEQNPTIMHRSQRRRTCFGFREA